MISSGKSLFTLDDLKKEADVLDGTQRELMEQPILEGKYQKKEVSGDKELLRAIGRIVVLEGGGAIRIYTANYLRVGSSFTFRDI